MFTFILVSSLFLLWGFCNGMIDVMDKHFQEELGLTKSQSAWVQFAHYLGYFLMSMPAGWLASKLGYKGGIIAGLLIVAVGGFWFIPATHINSLVHAGQCLGDHGLRRLPRGCLRHRHGLTFLETIANPYTTVLGASASRPRASTWRNPATASAGSSARSSAACSSIRRTPRATARAARRSTFRTSGVAIVVLVIAVVFYFANVPDIKMEDDYHLDDADAGRFALHLVAPALRAWRSRRSSSTSPRRPGSSASSSTT